MKNFCKDKAIQKNLVPLVEVELMTGDGDRIHPNQLKSLSKYVLKDSPIINVPTNSKQTKTNKYKIYYLVNDEKITIDGLIVTNVPRYLIEEELERYYFKLEQINKTKFKQTAKFFAQSEISKFGELKQARLKFQAVLYNTETKMLEKCISKPVQTNTITDVTFDLLNRPEKIEYYTHLGQNIRILRSSKIVGNVNGNEEVFLFTEVKGKVSIDDFEIEFNQKENNQITWTDKIQPDIVYNDSIFIFRTPRYTRQLLTESKLESKDSKKTSVNSKELAKTKLCEHPAKVFFRLYRKSTKEYSSEWTFYYSKSKHSILDDISSSFVDELNSYLANECDSTKNNSEENVSMETENSGAKKTTLNYEEENNESDDSELGAEEAIEADKPNEKQEDAANIDTVKNLVEDRQKKMNLLVDRTCAALLDVAQSRSIHKLIKIQRYLLNVKNEDGNTPIHIAILNGHFDLAEIYVDIALTIPHYNIINVKNNLQLTPLLLAAHMEEYEMCSFLLDSSASLAEVILADYDLQGDNCFHIAAKKKNINLTKVLVNYVNSNLDKAYLMNLCNYEGETPLHIACKNNSYEVVEEFLFSDLCKINEQNKRSGETPLHYTCSRNYIQLTKLLVKNLLKRKEDIDVQSFCGVTPLHMAIANQNYLITRLLVKSKANKYVQSLESIHGNCLQSYRVLSRKEDENNSQLFNFQLKKIKFIKNDGKFNSLEDPKKAAEMIISNINVDKVGVEITDTRSEEQSSSGKINIPGLLLSKGKLFSHCCDAYSYGLKDQIMLKLIDTLNDLYMSKDDINKIMDFELKKKFEYSLNLKQCKLTSNIKNSQMDFIKAIENQMRNLNEGLSLKVKIRENENDKASKRHTDSTNEDFKRTKIKEKE